VPVVPRPLLHAAEAIEPEVAPADVAPVQETSTPWTEPAAYVAASEVAPRAVAETQAPEEYAAPAIVHETEALSAAQPEPVESQPAQPEPVQPEPVQPEPVQPEPVQLEPEKPVTALPELKLEWPSDLVQIETDQGKVRSAATAIAEAAPAPRPRRVRPAPTPVSDEPLVQVETRKPEAVAGE
jgi:hypothetical protein